MTKTTQPSFKPAVSPCANPGLTHEPLAAVALGQQPAGHVAERVAVEKAAEDEALRLGVPRELAAALFEGGKNGKCREHVSVSAPLCGLVDGSVDQGIGS